MTFKFTFFFTWRARPLNALCYHPGGREPEFEKHWHKHIKPKQLACKSAIVRVFKISKLRDKDKKTIAEAVNIK